MGAVLAYQPCMAPVPKTTQKTRCGGTRLESQHLGSRGKQIRSSKSSLAKQQKQGQPGLYELCLKKQEPELEK